MSEQDEQIRKKFEQAFTVPEGVRWCNHQEMYTAIDKFSEDDGRNTVLQNAKHKAYKAGRESVVVELPAAEKQTSPYTCYENGWNDMRQETIEAIKAAGGRIK